MSQTRAGGLKGVMQKGKGKWESYRGWRANKEVGGKPSKGDGELHLGGSRHLLFILTWWSRNRKMFYEGVHKSPPGPHIYTLGGAATSAACHFSPFLSKCSLQRERPLTLGDSSTSPPALPSLPSAPCCQLWVTAAVRQSCLTVSGGGRVGRFFFKERTSDSVISRSLGVSLTTTRV